MKRALSRIIDYLRINTQSPYECYWSRRAINAESRVRELEEKNKRLEQQLERQ